ncbi:MAG: diacylglycerol kinase family lipid kinase [Bacillota bacterium]|nr:diacylglycerol kinase family lipid kinase [Bacillota bacterium]MDW7684282.1 diacylglycerol kinase family lipid kinase [Bacillota bacterium]
MNSQDLQGACSSQTVVLHFIINPTASSGGAVAVWEEVKTYLDQAGVQYQFAFSKNAQDVVRLAKAAASPGSVVAGVGGDGTLSAIAGAIAGTEAALGVIPGGTGNDFARTFAIPRDPVKACRVLLEGVRIPVDIGRLNGQCFLNVVGAGLDAEVVADANRIFKRLSGSLGYMLALLKQLISFRPRPFRVTVDGNVTEVKAWLVTVANARYYGSGMHVAPEADPQDGLADVVLVTDLHRLNFLRLFPLVYKGKHIFHPAVRVLRGAEISVECQQSSYVHADGDLVGKTPLDVSMWRHAVWLMAPAPE